jgi:hypothetical protein
MTSQTQGRTSGWVSALIGVALTLLLTAGVIQFSLRHGRLLFPPDFDDCTYLCDAAARLDVLLSGGVLALVEDLWRVPPHAPGSTGLALFCFLVLGVHTWAPYVGNGLYILALLLFAGRILKPFRLPGYLAGLLLVCSVPVVALTVYHFRPDLAVGLATSMGVFLALEHGILTVPWSRRLAIALCFSAALLIKPSFCLMTVFLLGCTVVTATVQDVCSDRSRLSWRNLAAGWLGCGLALLPVVPFYALTWRKWYGYIYQAIYGHLKEILRTPGDRWYHLKYFLLGEGGQTLLGSHLYLLGAIFVVGVLAALLFGSRQRRARVVAMLALLGATYAVPAHIEMKLPVFGSGWAYLLLFCSLHLLVELLQPQRDRRGWCSWRALAVSGLAGLGLCCFRAPEGWSDANSPHHQGICRLFDGIERTLAEHSGGSARVFLTEGIYPNSWTLRFRALASGRSGLTFWDCHTVFDLAFYKKQIKQADFVLCTDGSRTTNFYVFPCLALQRKLLRYLQRRRDFSEIGRFYSVCWGGYRLFQRRRQFSGYHDCCGLLPLAGPDPEHGLPRGRWGILDATKLVVQPVTERSAVLVCRGRPKPHVRAMVVCIDGQPVARHVFTGPKTFDTLRLPLHLGPGQQTIELRYDYRPAKGQAPSPYRVLFTLLRLETADSTTPDASPSHPFHREHLRHVDTRLGLEKGTRQDTPR